MTAFAASSEEGVRIRAIVLWTAAGLLVAGAHTACALVFLDWRAPAPTLGEPPAAIMIDLPAKARGIGDQPNGDEAADAMPAAATQMTASDEPMQNDARAQAIMAQSASLPIASGPTARVDVVKPRKSRRRVHKAAKHDRHLAERRRLIPSWIDEAETSAAAPAARAAIAAMGSAVTAADVPSTWKSALLAQLERYKRYPEAARGEREEGTALLSFTIDREGHVLDSFVAHSSGFTPLDDETLAMLQRAAPLPKIPPEVPGDTLQLVVPVRFSEE